MKKKLFNELNESINQAIELNAVGKRDNLRMTVSGEKVDFVLRDEKWQEFNKKLNAPKRELPTLRELLKN